jgi:3-demethoxyubiquinol 3-hydroxylase|tara:strand:+ start:5762 stop:6388 length:627 start_codon:yes stop_codon:yes gene_type:complete
MSSRRYSAADQLLMRLGKGLAHNNRSPADAMPAKDAHLSASERREAGNLMRVNHAGEVAAQGLYHGQALTAKNEETRKHLLTAAAEEQTHLQWCEQRLAELNDGPSRLRPLWYGGSLVMGAVAGLFGDRWSLGFVAETERQVSEHLDEHIDRLPPEDQASRKVLQAMREDEQRHGNEAEKLGGVALPAPVRGLMRQVAKLMKEGAYRF